MRALSADVTAQQLWWGFYPATKFVFTSGATTHGYLLPTIRYCREIEQFDSQTAHCIMDNSLNTFTSLALQGYKGVLSWGIYTGVSRSSWVANTAYSEGDVVIPTTPNRYQYRCTNAGTSHATTEPTWTTAIGTTIADGATLIWTVDGIQGEEYSDCAPMWVEAQQLDSIRQKLTCHFSLAGMFNRMSKDYASADYIQTAENAYTIKTLFTSVADATIAPFNHCADWNVVYDSGEELPVDDLIDVYKPADDFQIKEGESRYEVLRRLLNYVKSDMYPGNDGNLHVINPKVSGTSYDSTYSLEDDTHKFLSETYRTRLIIPNKVTVSSRTNDTPDYTGSYTSGTSYALLPHDSPPYRYKVLSNEQCTSIAGAIIQKAELDAEKGVAIAPMNIGSELWDYVKVTDSKLSDVSRVGNLQYIDRTVDLRQENPMYQIMFTFGKSGSSALGTVIPIDIGIGGGGFSVYERLTKLEFYQDLLTTFDTVQGETNVEFKKSLDSLEKRTPILNKTVGLPFIIGDGILAITAGVQGIYQIPFACVIKAVRLAAPLESGSIVIDIWKDTYANLIPTDADSITASAEPKITTAQKSEDTTLTGWTKTINAGDWLVFNVDSCTDITQCTIELEVTKI
uniref:Putative tail protein n=1 Tax=viral metagenome TaxID=1070528 RepID=A0A6M3KM64_9ZZZZ